MLLPDLRRFSTFCLAISLSLSVLQARAGLTESIAQIECLLAEGKKVAILLVDMQMAYGTELYFSPLKKTNLRITRVLKNLLMHFSSSDSIEFVNIRIHFAGHKIKTITSLEEALKLKKTWQFFKRGNGAFEEESINDGFQGLENLVHGTLGDHLQSQGVSDVMITGCFDGRCVYGSAKGALREQFEVHIDRSMDISVSADKARGLSRGELQDMSDKSWKKLESEFQGLHMIEPAPSLSDQACAMSPSDFSFRMPYYDATGFLHDDSNHTITELLYRSGRNNLLYKISMYGTKPAT